MSKIVTIPGYGDVDRLWLENRRLSEEGRVPPRPIGTGLINFHVGVPGFLPAIVEHTINLRSKRPIDD